MKFCVKQLQFFFVYRQINNRLQAPALGASATRAFLLAMSVTIVKGIEIRPRKDPHRTRPPPKRQRWTQKSLKRTFKVAKSHQSPKKDLCYPIRNILLG